MAQTAKAGTFEWVAGWSDELARLLDPVELGLDVAANLRAVDIGCGTSEVPLHLSQVTRTGHPQTRAHCSDRLSCIHMVSPLLRCRVFPLCWRSTATPTVSATCARRTRRAAWSGWRAISVTRAPRGAPCCDQETRLRAPGRRAESRPNSRY